MKRYIAFYGDNYYPNGGTGDLVGGFDTIEDAEVAIDEKHLTRRRRYGLNPHWKNSWANVLDTETMDTVLEK